MTTKPNALIRFNELKQLLGNISRSTIFRWERDGTFPRHLILGKNSVAWLLSDVEQWIANRSMRGDLCKK